MQRFECCILPKLSFQPSLTKPATNHECDRCASHVAHQRDGKPPPETKEKTAADTQHSAWQEQDIAARVEQRITNRAPDTPMHHVLLHVLQPFRERKKARQDRE